MSSKALVISGTARHSLGAALSEQFLDQFDLPVIALDLDLNESLSGRRNVAALAIDLNPFSYPRASDLAENLLDQLRSALHQLNCSGCEGIIQCAGKYTSGMFVNTVVDERLSLVGVNVAGKLELLHAVMSVNEQLGFANSNRLTYIDIGTLHCVRWSPQRSLYVTTKYAGLSLCQSLFAGNEVARALHVAPGPIDTHMLHRNHWVTKQCGPAEFFDFLRNHKDQRLYRQVFMECKREVFAEACELYGIGDLQQMADGFHRYTILREEIKAGRDGLMTPELLAHTVASIYQDATRYPSGLVSATAPNGSVCIKLQQF